MSPVGAAMQDGALPKRSNAVQPTARQPSPRLRPWFSGDSLAVTVKVQFVTARGLSVRPVPTGWQQLDGAWRWSTVDPARGWELVCRDCGDDAGPVEAQVPEIAVLRGPYVNRSDALAAMAAHDEA